MVWFMTIVLGKERSGKAKGYLRRFSTQEAWFVPQPHVTRLVTCPLLPFTDLTGPPSGQPVPSHPSPFLPFVYTYQVSSPLLPGCHQNLFPNHFAFLLHSSKEKFAHVKSFWSILHDLANHAIFAPC